MKYTLTIYKLFLIVSISYSQPQLITTDVEWQRVKTTAKRLNKPVFIDFFTTWCGPCKQMDKTVFSQDSVKIFLNEYFIAVKVDAEKTIGKKLGTGIK